MKFSEICFAVIVITSSTLATPIDTFLKTTGSEISVNTGCNVIIGKRRNGHLKEGVQLKEVDWFLGIPFASNKRFKKPRKVKCNNSTLDATMFSNMCVQINVEEYEANEDCLNLNIYSPVSDDKPHLPVMVYIHGGSFAAGKGSNYIGDNLAQHGVVVVTFNYRLSVFGFFSTAHRNLKGNYGLYDQIEALKWVQRYIGNFRGDPRKVTIFGNSAGGASVGFHAMLPKSRGLFSQIIVQSGSPLAFWAFSDFNKFEREILVREVASLANCHQEKMDEIIACMRTVKITSADLKIIIESMTPLSPANTEFVPVIDDDLIQQTPSDSNVTFDGPLMAGVVSREFQLHKLAWIQFYYRLQDVLRKGFNNKSQEFKTLSEISEFLFTNYFIDYTKEDVDKIHDHYKIYPNSSQNDYIDLLSDIFLVLPTLKFALKYQKYTNKNAYFYQFNHTANFTIPGNMHEIELHYIFGYDFNELYKGNMVSILYGIDEDPSRYLMKLWTNFAKYGNPNGMSDKNGDKQVWKPLSDSLNCFNINNERSSEMIKNYKSENLNFWENMRNLKVRFPTLLSKNDKM